MLLCTMRTPLDLDEGLVRELRKRAAHEGRTLTSLVEEAIRLLLRSRSSPRRFRLRWVVRKGEGPAAVDVVDRVALYDWMEGRR